MIDGNTADALVFFLTLYLFVGLMLSLMIVIAGGTVSPRWGWVTLVLLWSAALVALARGPRR